MRHQGRIRQWQDEKGFGFVEPNGGGTRAFVHARAFSDGERRPVDGDLITYRAEQDEQGRWRAAEVRHARTTLRTSVQADEQASSTPLGAGLAAIYTAAIAVVCATGRWPWLVLGAVALMSLLALAAYAYDKRAARTGSWRTPEAHLHLVALLGGWPGAALAQHWLRHKSRKRAFRAGFWVTVMANVAVALWLFGPSGRAFLATMGHP